MATGHASKDYTSIPKEAAEQVRNRIAYASFGNGGLTATANAHGRLLQITRYFGEEQKKFGNPSGFVCVEFAELPPPHFIVSRLARLESHTKSSRNGMRFGIEANGDDGSWEMSTNIPRMEFFRDRWPRFITVTNAFDVDIEYRIRKNTLYQVYTYKKKDSEALVILPLPRQTISVEPIFRHLDFSRKDQDLKHECVKEINEEGNVLRIQKKAKQNGITTEHNTACLLLSLFIDGRAQRYSLSGDGETIEYAIDSSDWSELQKNGETQIALAYTLEQISSQHKDINDIPPVSFIDSWRVPEETEIKFKEPSFVGDARLNFALRRNLEHILSVCSIPVAELSVYPEPSAEPSAESSSTVVAASEQIPLIALTCGDVSGHRISTAASFYAFKVLLHALKLFSKKAKSSCKSLKRPCQSYDCSASSQNLCKSYDCYMRLRIWKVCYGHIKWLYKNLQHDSGKHYICPHYWASGGVIEDWESHSFLRGRSLADTPFHIIKAADFCKIARNKDIKKEIAKGIQPIIENWIKELDARNKQGKYAFPHFREEPTHIFYFSDHVMIWRGLKSIEDLDMVQELKPAEPGRKLSYTSSKIRTNILKRFTTKNRLSNQRMLTMIRSPPETRFLLQLEDAVLFDAADLGLFEKTTTSPNKNQWNNKIDVWKSMIKFQIDQIGNEGIDWIHPLQFALAMMMSAKDWDIDSRSKDQMAETFEYSKSVLLESSSCNGLFPGQLDENKEPILFSEELRSEDYWYTTFELPYILWTYQMQPKSASGTPPPRRSATSQAVSNARHQEGFTTQKNIPFDDIIDTRNIVEYTDEWMYNEPKFFGQEYGELQSSVNEFSAADKKTTHKDQDKKTTHEQIMLKVIGNQTQHPDSKAKGYLIDVPKSKSFWEKDKQITKEISETKISKNDDMYDSLAKKRLPEKAKKRLVHFYGPNPETALICYLASSEPDEISSFFQRHALYEKYCFDEITPILNTWETELHLSFYRITKKDPPKAPDTSSSGTSPEDTTPSTISPSDEIEFPHNYQRNQNEWISRAAMSFRFDGDAFDRYWTCHFFENEPQRAKVESDLHVSKILAANKPSKGDPWKQRQVLESLLFDEILREMLKGTQDILESVKTAGLKNPMNHSSAQNISLTSPLSDPLDLFREITGDVFDSTTQLWRKLHHILQVVEDDLSKNLTNIRYWRDRQASRGPSRPRWTLKDERGYRSAISKLLASNDQNIIKLERCYADIESFKMLLSKRLEITREDLDLRRANDLRLFTYVTVVFLPISFATGVFSMSDAPTAGLVGSMATTATVALLVTVVALVSAKTLEAYIARPLISIFRRIIYNPIISPCVYFLARYLFFPLYNLLSDNMLPQGSERSFLEKLMKIGAISEARKDFFTELEKPNKRKQGKKSMGSDILAEQGESQACQAGSSSEETLREASSERPNPSSSSLNTGDSTPTVAVSPRLSAENERLLQ